MIKHIILAAVTWPFWATIKAIGIATGLVIVPIALLFRTEEKIYDTDPKKAYPSRKLVHLPKWAWIWDNDAEGMMSWMKNWPSICWDGDPTTFLSMFQWAAVRNPANNLRFIRGIAVYLPDVEEAEYWGKEVVSDKWNVDGEGWQFVRCKGKYFPYYSFYWVGKKLTIRLGHKIEPAHFKPEYLIGKPERKLWKGMTFRPIQIRRGQ